MALVHDLAESLVGDITPHDGVSKEEKYRLENVSNMFVVQCFRLRKEMIIIACEKLAIYLPYYNYTKICLLCRNSLPIFIIMHYL